MAQPIIIQDATLRNYLGAFHDVFGAPQWKYFETVLMGMIHCQASRTLSSLLRGIAGWVTVSGLSRFLISPAWTSDELARARYAFFREEVTPLVAKAHATQRLDQPKRKGRPSPTVVTGYLILDDSTHVKRYAKKMNGLGWHYSSTDQRSLPGIVFLKVCISSKAISTNSRRICIDRNRSVSEKACLFRAKWIWLSR